MNTTLKIQVEAFWAFRRAIDLADQKYIVSGLAADLYFVLSKKGCMHFKDCPDDYRAAGFERISCGDSQSAKLHKYCRSVGKRWLNPWVTKGMLNEFQGTTWDALNKPKQKQPIREQFADYLDELKIYNHSDMHKGDSGIAAHFEQLLDDPVWNKRGYKSVKGIYNRVIAGELTAKSSIPKKRRGLLC